MSLPIDPISHEPIPPERQVKITMLSQEQYFDIDNLHTWFVTRGEPINPLTNIGFTKQQLQDIRARYISLSKQFPPFLHSHDDMKQQEEEKQQEIVFLQQQLNLWCANVQNIEQIRNLLYTHSLEIEQDQFSINGLRNVPYETVSSVTPLMNAVYNDNLLAVQELLLFNPEMNYVDPKYNYKAIDLAVLSNKPHSTEILKSLLFYGANVNIPTKNGLSVELTDDIVKLELLYGFMYD